MNITVYLGANEGTDPALKTAVQELGKWIGESGNALIYGGSRCGLMGVLADSVLAAGGEVTGVEPEFFVKGELQHDGLTELIVTKEMTERKPKLLERVEAPCILYDLDGYYAGLRMLLDHMIELGLSSKERQKGICFAKDLPEIQKILQSSL